MKSPFFCKKSFLPKWVINFLKNCAPKRGVEQHFSSIIFVEEQNEEGGWIRCRLKVWKNVAINCGTFFSSLRRIFSKLSVHVWPAASAVVPNAHVRSNNWHKWQQCEAADTVEVEQQFENCLRVFPRRKMSRDDYSKKKRRRRRRGIRRCARFQTTMAYVFARVRSARIRSPSAKHSWSRGAAESFSRAINKLHNQIEREFLYLVFIGAWWKIRGLRSSRRGMAGRNLRKDAAKLSRNK